MDHCLEDYCKRCGETFDPTFGCRCALVPCVDESRAMRPVRIRYANCEPVLASKWLASLVSA
jgi:hypothetical protein